MTEEEFRSGKLANGERLMRPDKVEAFHQVGLEKLHNHFKAMQAKAAEYLEPDIYVPRVGAHAVYEHGPQRDRLFADDMLYMLEGPEQREAEAEIEKPFDYVAEAALTCSPQWHGDMIPKSYFELVLFRAIESLGHLDAVKKTLFYGKEHGCGPVVKGSSISDVPYIVPDLSRQQAVDYIHGVIGIATEAGELLEGLRDTLRGKPLDAVNVEEEVGDAKWYMAILARTFGFLWGNDERKNIAKLRARFPDKFTEYDANNRNLAVEREILEGSPEELMSDFDYMKYLYANDPKAHPSTLIARFRADRPENDKAKRTDYMSLLVGKVRGVYDDLILEQRNEIAMQQQRGPIGDCEGMDC